MAHPIVDRIAVLPSEKTDVTEDGIATGPSTLLWRLRDFDDQDHRERRLRIHRVFGE